MFATAGTLVIALGMAGAGSDSGAVREILQKERCQTELPLPEAMKTSGATLTPPIPSGGGRSGPRDEGEAPGPVIRIPVLSTPLTAILVAIVVAVALAFLLRNLPERRPDVTPDEAGTGRPEAKRPVRKVDDADRLAREGRFGEAIHALLLRALAELGRSASAPALTSREVLRTARLALDARQALGALVSAVELVHFGAKPAGAAEYAACAAEYRRFKDKWHAGA
jgi:hypothetical protein